MCLIQWVFVLLLSGVEGWKVPSIRPLETLHNSLTHKQVESFLARITDITGSSGSSGGVAAAAGTVTSASASASRTPASSPASSLGPSTPVSGVTPKSMAGASNQNCNAIGSQPMPQHPPAILGLPGIYYLSLLSDEMVNRWRCSWGLLMFFFYDLFIIYLIFLFIYLVIAFICLFLHLFLCSLITYYLILLFFCYECMCFLL